MGEYAIPAAIVLGLLIQTAAASFWAGRVHQVLKDLARRIGTLEG